MLIIFQSVSGTRIALDVVNVEADVEGARTRPNRGATESLRASTFLFATTTTDGLPDVPTHLCPSGWWMLVGICIIDAIGIFFREF